MLGGGGHKFQDMGGAVSRYGRGCVGGWGKTFRDIGGAVLGVEGGTYSSRYGRCCFEIWEVLRWWAGGRPYVMLWWPSG